MAFQADWKTHFAFFLLKLFGKKDEYEYLFMRGWVWLPFNLLFFNKIFSLVGYLLSTKRVCLQTVSL